MLIFENGLVLKSDQLKSYERKLKRIDRAQSTTAALGIAGISVGLITALFNGLVPRVGSMFGVMDTWGRPDFVPEQLLMAVVSLGAMVAVSVPLSIRGDRLENQRRELEQIETAKELEAPKLEQDEPVEYWVERKPKWDSLDDYRYYLSSKRYE